MNPTNPISGPLDAWRDLRIPRTSGDGQKRRDPSAGDAFRRALEQQDGEAEAGATDPAPERSADGPTPPRLQPQPARSRRDEGGPSQHVDVVA